MHSVFVKRIFFVHDSFSTNMPYEFVVVCLMLSFYFKLLILLNKKQHLFCKFLLQIFVFQSKKFNVKWKASFGFILSLQYLPSNAGLQRNWTFLWSITNEKQTVLLFLHCKGIYWKGIGFSFPAFSCCCRKTGLLLLSLQCSILK